jgi:hypothetical protein
MISKTAGNQRRPESVDESLAACHPRLRAAATGSVKRRLL